ncbi:hypothetical protein LWP59_33505 [Amycolatopsis acidiphila]|uniref:Uncharacterized protein n=1 Tax=Amycolatopsis acidiphila TaxID=715473 RepID=A0A558A4E5_9PSEU|nr:hypothetical protein [Amycolatopsis acidiphila]TVT19122.1 hypothetical protein FNH06_25425 [Amycolatopsis acidiphila]UIJ58945.1 hypothetical protein LWP59_33505 [Amycolatopsis acidiphila]GHG72947.1 hypothetical protein GCM10017788_35860 [Amycolatopsis acidiphila]
MRRPTFLPLTTDAAVHAGAHAVLHRATEADRAADACWATLLAGSEASRCGLDARLRKLSEATSVYVGTKWWFNEGSAYRRRVARAQICIEDAITEGDGSEFAQAFMGYDHAMASALVCTDERGRGKHRARL